MAEHNNGDRRGTLYVVGTGPGSRDHITPAVGKALSKADIIIGYRTYLQLIPEFLEGKEVVASEMMKEIDRCRKSLELAENGKNVALVSGGDPGIYAMAGLAYELARDNEIDCKIEVIPGIAAVNGCAARLGAPLMHDFATISMSDLLTPWDVIEKRLEAAAAADFVVAIYNPKSKKRVEQIVKARQIFLKYRSPETPVGIVTAATRENETIIVSTLANMLEEDIGMQSTVIIGNTQTYVWNTKMITPRGYGTKYDLK